MPVDVLIRPFLKELDFEKALADFLPQHGWEPNVIMNPTEDILETSAKLLLKFVFLKYFL